MASHSGDLHRLLHRRTSHVLQRRRLPLHPAGMAHSVLADPSHWIRGSRRHLLGVRNGQNSVQHSRNGNQTESVHEDVLESNLGCHHPHWCAWRVFLHFEGCWAVGIPRLQVSLMGRRFGIFHRLFDPRPNGLVTFEAVSLSRQRNGES